MALIKRYGQMWARNPKNLRAIPSSKQGGQGVYILYDGSMPVYIGRGNIRQRIYQAARSKSRGQMWEHFSWYIPADPQNEHDLEALLIRMLPPSLRILNNQGAALTGASDDARWRRFEQAQPITRESKKKKTRKDARKR